MTLRSYVALLTIVLLAVLLCFDSVFTLSVNFDLCLKLIMAINYDGHHEIRAQPTHLGGLMRGGGGRGMRL